MRALEETWEWDGGERVRREGAVSEREQYLRGKLRQLTLGAGRFRATRLWKRHEV